MKKKKFLEELPDWIDPIVWEQYQIHRRNIKKPMTDYAEHLCVIKLGKAREQGHDPNELINTTIEKGWQGIVIPDNPPNKRLVTTFTWASPPFKCPTKQSAKRINLSVSPPVFIK